MSSTRHHRKETARSAAMTPDHHTLARLPDSPPHWLESYPAHLCPAWKLASGESLRVRPVRHDDSELEEAFVRALSLQPPSQRPLTRRTQSTPHSRPPI